MIPVAPTSICPVARAVAMGAAAWKKTSSGSIPYPLKKPLSTPMKRGAEELSLSAPIFTADSARADLTPAPSTAMAAARAMMAPRRIRKPPPVTRIMYGATARPAARTA